MTLLRYEWRKLFRLPALWGFVALSLLFNAFLIGAQWNNRALFNGISEEAACLGQRVDDDFRSGLQARPKTEAQQLLISAADGVTDVFEIYDARQMTAYYQEMLPNLSPWMVERLQWKYEKAQERVEHFAEADAALDLYAGPVTDGSHEFLFGTLLLAILGEAAVAAVLIPLLLTHYEDQQRTTALVCSSKTGRRLWHTKLLAALSGSVLLYGLLVLGTLLPYFLLWDYSGIWDASVASQFHHLTEMLLKRPFMTWADFTVGGYLAAVLCLGCALTLVFCLLGMLCGVLMRRSYLAAMAAGILLFAPLALSSVAANCGLWQLFVLLSVSPTRLWVQSSGWFTELGLNALVPWQETWGTVWNLLALGCLTALALVRFARKDVMT